MDKAEQDKQSAIIRAQGEVRHALLVSYVRLSEVRALSSLTSSPTVAEGFACLMIGAQAQSAKLIGDAIQKNPAFLTLRKIEVR